MSKSPKNPQIPPSAPRVVEILTFPFAQILDVAGPFQVFATANGILLQRGDPPAYEIRVVGPSEAIVAAGGLTISTEPLPALGPLIDTLIIAGGRGVMVAIEQAELVEWVKQRAQAAKRVASVCTGAFMLGAAGLLDGRRAVTHWEFCPQLANRFPRATIDPRPIFIRDDPIWTSAGVTSGIDLSLALVEQDLGRAIMLTIARRLVVFPRRPGDQAQFSDALTLHVASHSFAELHAWIESNLARDLSLREMAARAGMSERTFSRRYRDETGFTPSHGVERLRVEAARRLLLDTHLPAKRIAVRCGFGAEDALRRAFLRVHGVGPKDYRDRFR
ncbi:HTH-type+transcriptional+activator+RhaS [Methylocapsa aurea]